MDKKVMEGCFDYPLGGQGLKLKSLGNTDLGTTNLFN